MATHLYIDTPPVTLTHDQDFDPDRLDPLARNYPAAIERAAELVDPRATHRCDQCGQQIGMDDEGNWYWATLAIDTDGTLTATLCEGCSDTDGDYS